MFDLFASSVWFQTSAVYIGEGPVAEHHSWWPGIARTTRAGSGKIMFGASKKKKLFFYPKT